MAVDLTGGLNDEREYVFATQPENPDLRESVNVWIWDCGTDVGLPCLGIEAVADQWDTHDIQLNISFADGKVFNCFGPGDVHDVLGADGRPRWSSARVRSRSSSSSRSGTGGSGSTASRWRARSRIRSRDAAQMGSRVFPSRSTSTSGRRCRRGRTERSSPRRSVCSRSRTRACSWAGRGSSSCPALRGRCAWATANTASMGAHSASGAVASGASAPSGVTSGSRRSSRAGVRSDSSCTRRVTTGFPRTTRATSSKATAS